jgi:hypothetical protein
MKINKLDFAVVLFLVLISGWFLGRITEALALGNL